MMKEEEEGGGDGGGGGRGRRHRRRKKKWERIKKKKRESDGRNKLTMQRRSSTSPGWRSPIQAGGVSGVGSIVCLLVIASLSSRIFALNSWGEQCTDTLVTIDTFTRR